MKSLFALMSVGLFLLGFSSSAHGHGFGRAGGGVAVRTGGVAAGGYRGGSVARGAAVGPYGAAAGGGRRGTVVTPGGTTVQAGRVGGVAAGPGGVRAGGAQGVRVTTPSGRSYATGSAGRAAVGPYGAVAGRSGVAAGPRGVAVGHSTYYRSPTAFAARATTVRRGYYPYFNRSWYVNHPVAWRPARWVGASYWVAPTWVNVVPYVGLNVGVSPYDYDYGSTVVYNDNRVYSDGVLLGTADEYANKAIRFAQAGREANLDNNDEFQPLGVFGAIQKDEDAAQHIFQLGVNKAGVVRGNYYDALTDQTTLVFGSVDPRSQRVAWTVGDKKKDIVFEAGLYNLTQNQCNALVHYGNTRTVQISLIRLEEPQDQPR